MSVLAALGLTAAMAAHADTQPSFYMGAGFGTTKVGGGGGALGVGDLGDVDGVDDSDTGFKVFGGYNFNQNFAVELSYFDLGEAGASVSDGIDTASFSIGISGFGASAVGTLPVSDMFSVFAKLGFASYDVDGDASVSGFGSASFSESESDMTYGVGGALGFGQFGLRLEYEAINVDDGDANMISLSGVYHF
jgi:OOP family OmpA-OmpF porin